jgi:hypothetical protein
MKGMGVPDFLSGLVGCAFPFSEAHTLLFPAPRVRKSG